MIDRNHIAKVRQLLAGRNEAALERAATTDTETLERLGRKVREHEHALFRAKMHLSEYVKDAPEAKRRAAAVLPAEDAVKAVSVEVWSTLFDAPGDDYSSYVCSTRKDVSTVP